MLNIQGTHTVQVQFCRYVRIRQGRFLSEVIYCILECYPHLVLLRNGICGTSKKDLHSWRSQIGFDDFCLTEKYSLKKIRECCKYSMAKKIHMKVGFWYNFLLLSTAADVAVSRTTSRTNQRGGKVENNWEKRLSLKK